MSDKRYSIDELACALEAHFRRPGNDLSRFQVDAIIARLRKADKLAEAAHEAHLELAFIYLQLHWDWKDAEVKKHYPIAINLSKAISDYEE